MSAAPADSSFAEDILVIDGLTKRFGGLVAVGRRIERHYGKPQDIEWALDQDGNVLLLQSRPETVWSAKDAAPVAPVAANPLAHVMNIFGGRK